MPLLNFILFIRILAILFIVLSPYKLFSKNIDLEYEIDWKTLHIANLFLTSQINEDRYTINSQITSVGLFNKLYPYELTSLTLGKIFNDNFLPSHFSYNSKTKKKSKSVEILFSDSGLINNHIIIPKPEEVYTNKFESIKVNKYFTDPISQLFQFFLLQTNTNRTTIDGRRIYVLKSNLIDGRNFDFIESINFKGDTKGLRITFPFYLSLWKDSKDDSNHLEFIDIYYTSISNNDIPIQIVIKTKKIKAFLNLISYNIDN